MGAASPSNLRVPCAILGSGNIATDLLYKLLRSSNLEPTAMIGIDPASDGLARAAREGLATSPEGVQWLQERATDFRLVFEATSARVHQKHAPILRELGLQTIDLTPAAIGPPVVPTVNIEAHLHEWNVNMVTCGGQATLPIVAAVTSETDVPYAEIISTISSRSAGPGTRQNIDEFTRVTGNSLIEIGGARTGKAIIILNPAEPPMIMRNTVYCGLSEHSDRESVRKSIEAMVERVQSFVPGYRLKSPPFFDEGPYDTPAGSIAARVVVFLEVEGSSDYLPSYAGNLDIMTAAAVRTGEAIVLASRAASP